MKEVTDKTRCNNCMNIYDENVAECEKCKTDAYLMQPFQCAHKDATGPTVFLGSIGDFSDYQEAVWECDKCGETIPPEMYDKLDLNDPAEAYAENLQDQAEQQRDYEASR